MAQTFDVLEAPAQRTISGGLKNKEHEKWDGTGYPNGLAGEAISQVARIVAVADVFDALTSERPYKNAWPDVEALPFAPDLAVICTPAGSVPELLVAVSCSKNFGLYRERVGVAMVFNTDAQARTNAFAQLLGLIRANYSMPPDHGAAVVAHILQTPALAAQWRAELSVMRTRLTGLRSALAQACRERLGHGRFDAIAQQQGMFSLLGLSKDQVEQLRITHAVYMPSDSRTNIAGLRQAQIPAFVNALAAVGAGQI